MTYKEEDKERFLNEPAKRPGRTEFMRDRARVIHSASLRRLAAKTQVAVPWENDFQRTRLSHSLECAQIGRELGESLGADPDLQDTACLSHDLGHPPFGHNGEEALAEIAKEFGGFEGNAQSFRLLVRLEAKTVDSDGKSIGLNLTRASLDGATKYPWPRSQNPRKFGVYDDDLEVFNWMRTGAPVDKKCIEAQIMDWSDDCAYSVHDLEDAIFVDQISVKNFERDLADIYNVMKSDYGRRDLNRFMFGFVAFKKTDALTVNGVCEHKIRYSAQLPFVFLLHTLKKFADAPPIAPPPVAPPEKHSPRSTTEDHSAGNGNPGAAGGPELREKPPKPTVELPPESYEYTIEPDQTLSGILAAYRKQFGLKTTMAHVEAANPGINPKKLKVGQKIKIPIVK